MSSTERLNPKWKDNHCNILGMPPAIVLDIAVISEEIFMDYIRLLFHCCDLHDEQNSMEEQFLISRLVFLKLTQILTNSIYIIQSVILLVFSLINVTHQLE